MISSNPSRTKLSFIVFFSSNFFCCSIFFRFFLHSEITRKMEHLEMQSEKKKWNEKLKINVIEKNYYFRFFFLCFPNERRITINWIDIIGSFIEWYDLIYREFWERSGFPINEKFMPSVELGMKKMDTLWQIHFTINNFYTKIFFISSKYNIFFS